MHRLHGVSVVLHRGAGALWRLVHVRVVIHRVVRAAHVLHVIHLHHHAGPVKGTGLHPAIGHAHGAGRGEGKNMLQAEIAHSVVEVRLGHLGGWVALAETDPYRRVARAVMGGSAEFVGSVGRDSDKHVIGFGNTDEKTLLLNRFHCRAVRSDDGHRAAGELEVKIGSG